jgi:hypothetical protein
MNITNIVRNDKVIETKIKSCWLGHISYSSLGSVITVATTGMAVTHWWVSIKTETHWYCAFILLAASVESKNGITWTIIQPSTDWVGSVGCNNNCDPYNGVTDCEQYLPILCITLYNLFPQPSCLKCNDSGSTPCWTGGIFTTTAPIRGADITTRQIADYECQR